MTPRDRAERADRIPALLIHYDNDTLSKQPRPVQIAGVPYQFFGVCPPVARIGGVA